MEDQLKIATKIILRISGIIALIWVTITLHQFILLALGSWVIVSAIDPIVSKLEEKRIPRSLSAIIISLSLLLTISLLLITTITPLTTQIQSLIQNFPTLMEKAVNSVSFWSQENIDSRIHPYIKQIGENLSQQTIDISGNLVKVGQGIINTTLSIITFFVITAYLLIEYPKVSSHLINFFPQDIRNSAEQKFTIINLRLGSWLRGQVVLMIAVGFTSWLGLVILGIPFALPLGILAGILEIIPTIGPTVSSIPSIIIGLAISPLKGLSVLIFYILIQQLENSLLVPQIMEQAVGLDPLVIIFALAVGERLLGFSGILMAIPLTIIVWTFLEQNLKTTIETAEKKEG